MPRPLEVVFNVGVCFLLPYLMIAYVLMLLLPDTRVYWLIANLGGALVGYRILIARLNNRARGSAAASATLRDNRAPAPNRDNHDSRDVGTP